MKRRRTPLPCQEDHQQAHFEANAVRRRKSSSCRRWFEAQKLLLILISSSPLLLVSSWMFWRFERPGSVLVRRQNMVLPFQQLFSSRGGATSTNDAPGTAMDAAPISPALQEIRLRSALWCLFAGDALASPTHWYYGGRTQIQRDYGAAGIVDYTKPVWNLAGSILKAMVYRGATKMILTIPIHCVPASRER